MHLNKFHSSISIQEKEAAFLQTKYKQTVRATKKRCQHCSLTAISWNEIRKQKCTVDA